MKDVRCRRISEAEGFICEKRINRDEFPDKTSDEELKQIIRDVTLTDLEISKIINQDHGVDEDLARYQDLKEEHLVKLGKACKLERKKPEPKEKAIAMELEMDMDETDELTDSLLYEKDAPSSNSYYETESSKPRKKKGVWNKFTSFFKLE